MLREHQIDEYVATDGVRCLYCKSTNIQCARNASWDDGSVERVTYCDDCHKEWMEIYRLSEIREIE